MSWTGNILTVSDYTTHAQNTCVNDMSQKVPFLSYSVILIDLLHNRQIFDLGEKKRISEKSVLNFVKLPSLAAKCCKVRKP